MIRLDGPTLAAIVAAFDAAVFYRENRQVCGVSIVHEPGSPDSRPYFDERFGNWLPGDWGEATETWASFLAESAIYDDDGELMVGEDLADWIAETFREAARVQPSISIEGPRITLMFDHDVDEVAA